MLKIHNTPSRKLEEYQPGNVAIRMFVCGPTVYDYIHLGNARTYVIFDVVAKYLRFKGYKLEYIQNITDIDDKIIARAHEKNQDPLAYARQFEEEFLKDAAALGITSPLYKRATEHIPEVIAQVQKLIDKGNAYLIEGDGYYFDLKTFPDYGKLSGRTAAMADDGLSRIDENEKKRNKGDFCLWKFSNPGKPSWNAPALRQAEGMSSAERPGWHIEDTAITEKYFGSQYEIHGGGQDLIFPHHEAEIAQQESASGLIPFVRYWMHAGLLTVQNARMGKSKGNFLTARDALKKFSAQSLRLFFLSSHYRSPLDYSETILAQSESGARRLSDFGLRLFSYKTEKTGVDKKIQEFIDAYNAHMDDDFNFAGALGIIFEMAKYINGKIDASELESESRKAALDFLKDIQAVMGIIPPHADTVSEKIIEFIREREQARKEKNFAKSDLLRHQIEMFGYTLDDTPFGTVVRKKT